MSSTCCRCHSRMFSSIKHEIERFGERLQFVKTRKRIECPKCGCSFETIIPTYYYQGKQIDWNQVQEGGMG